MKAGRGLKLAGLLATMVCGLAHADGIYFDAPSRTDMVYDVMRGIIYTANGSQVLRYDVVNNFPLAPITLGGNLKSIDISPDGKTLAVADGTYDGGAVHLVNLDTLVDTPATLVKSGVTVGWYVVDAPSNGGLPLPWR